MSDRTRKTNRHPFIATSEDTPVTQSYSSAVRERDRIIAGFSDVELIKFHEMGGTVPRDMRARLRRVLDAQIAEVAQEAGEFEGYGPEAGCEIPWVESCSACRRQHHAHVRRVRRKAMAKVTTFLASLEAA